MEKLNFPITGEYKNNETNKNNNALKKDKTSKNIV